MGQWLSSSFQESPHISNITINDCNNNQFDTISFNGVRSMKITLPIIQLNNTQYNRYVFIPEINKTMDNNSISKPATIDYHSISTNTFAEFDEQMKNIKTNTTNSNCSELLSMGNQIQIKLLNEVIHSQITYSQCLYRLSEVQKRYTQLMSQYFDNESNQSKTSTVACLNELNSLEICSDSIEDDECENNIYEPLTQSNNDVNCDYNVSEEYQVVYDNFNEQPIKSNDYWDSDEYVEIVENISSHLSANNLDELKSDSEHLSLITNEADVDVSVESTEIATNQVVPSISNTSSIATEINELDNTLDTFSNKELNSIKIEEYSMKKPDENNNFILDDNEVFLDQEEMSICLDKYIHITESDWDFLNVSTKNVSPASNASRPNSTTSLNNEDIMSAATVSVISDPWIQNIIPDECSGTSTGTSTGNSTSGSERLLDSPDDCKKSKKKQNSRNKRNKGKRVH